ncbi:response regulator transcription factor [Methylobacterium sp. 77]|uniref:response regulator transcription factor n=1 Tax=Methylobacterium sp. 77 TaxID=1101192 RepID=UPI000369AB84|nr:response regulator transcription factor [Methylobacterium sp. 77]
MSLTILVIDDEPPIRKLLRMGLTTQGYAILEAPNGRTALDFLARERVDLVILDLGLPDMRGHDLLRSLRERHRDLPVLVLSSRDDEPGKVEALDLGADDYVTKPFGMGELLARIRTALRHQLAQQGERPIFRVDGLSVDLVRRIVRVDGNDVKLTPREYDFLRVFVQHAGKALTHSQLMNAVSTSSDPQYLRVYIRSLRQKLEADPERPRILLTETGVGYRMRAPEEPGRDPPR